MERLTHKARYEAGYNLNRGVHMWQAIDRLAEYEDLGVTPEQIREIDRLYAEKCREVAELKRYKWIPVDERLPEERDTVLISTDTGTYAGIYFCDEWYRENMYCYDSMLRATGVMAWMPLPERYQPE